MKYLSSILLGLTITMLLPFDVKAIPEDVCIPGGIVGALSGALVGYKLPDFIKEYGLGEKLTGAAITAIPAGILGYRFLSHYTPHGRYERAKKCFGNYLDNNIDLNVILAQQNVPMTNENKAKKLFEIRQQVNQGRELLESAINGIEKDTKETETKKSWKMRLQTANNKITKIGKEENQILQSDSTLARQRVDNDTIKAKAEQGKASAQIGAARAVQFHVIRDTAKWILSNTYIKGILTGALIIVAGNFGIKKTFDYLFKKGTEKLIS